MDMVRADKIWLMPDVAGALAWEPRKNDQDRSTTDAPHRPLSNGSWRRLVRDEFIFCFCANDWHARTALVGHYGQQAAGHNCDGTG